MKKNIALTLCLLALTGCAYISGWWHDNPIPPIPIPTPPGPVVTNADGFVFGEWTWLGSLPCPKDAEVVPVAEIKTGVIRGNRIYLTYGSEAKTTQWWPPYDSYCYGPHALAYLVDGRWYAGRLDWFPISCRESEGVGNAWKADTPFADHPPARGSPAYWFVYLNNKRSNAVKVTWE